MTLAFDYIQFVFALSVVPDDAPFELVARLRDAKFGISFFFGEMFKFDFSMLNWQLVSRLLKAASVVLQFYL